MPTKITIEITVDDNGAVQDVQKLTIHPKILFDPPFSPSPWPTSWPSSGTDGTGAPYPPYNTSISVNCGGAQGVMYPGPKPIPTTEEMIAEINACSDSGGC